MKVIIHNWNYSSPHPNEVITFIVSVNGSRFTINFELLDREHSHCSVYRWTGGFGWAMVFKDFNMNVPVHTQDNEITVDEQYEETWLPLLEEIVGTAIEITDGD